MRFITALLLCLNVFLLGCTEEELTDEASSTVEDYLALTCLIPTDCADDSADGKFGQVHFFSHTNCAGFTGTGSKYLTILVLCTGGICAGVNSTNFLDANGSTTAPDQGSYSVYSYIDTNGNNTPDTGEPGECTDGVNWDGVKLSTSITTDEA